MILGHADERVVAAVSKALGRGCSFGAPTEAETKLAKLVIDCVASIEMVRFVNSGTEATMSALRLARGHTGRDAIIKIEGCYHGHVDGLLVKAGSGATTFGAPSSPGIPAGVTSNTLLAPFNDLEATASLFKAHDGQVAGLIVEPIAGNMGCVPPGEGYLQALRTLCDPSGTLLIFDEVMTGFRVAYGGAQELYGVDPDLTTLGKVIGGGLPVGAYAGKREIMEMVAPAGPMYQAGTLSGNPLAMTAGIETLKVLKEPGVYEELEAKTARLAEGIGLAARESQVPIYQTHVGTMFCTFFTKGPVTNYDTAKASDTVKFGTFFTTMLESGVYLAPSQFECSFVSLAHNMNDIELTLSVSRKAFEAIRN